MRPTSLILQFLQLRTSGRVAKAKKISVSDVTVVVLNRPRHAALLQELRDVGARIRLIQDGDVAAAIEAARPGTGIDILMGIGGTPEGVITAAAMICLGGTIQGQLAPRDDEERQKAIDLGHDLSKILGSRDLINSEDVFSLPRELPMVNYCAVSDTRVLER